MKRRTFLVSGAAAVSALAAWQFFGANTADVIQMIVRKRLDYLALDPEGVQRFAQDMAALHVNKKLRLKALSLLRPAYAQFSLSSGHNRFAYLLRHGRSHDHPALRGRGVRARPGHPCSGSQEACPLKLCFRWSMKARTLGCM